MNRIFLALLLFVSAVARGDVVQGVFYNPTLGQFQGNTGASGLVGFLQVPTGRSNGAFSDSPNVYSGSGTCTITTISGTSAVSGASCTWLRNGNTMHVSGTFTVTTSSGAFNAVSIALPIARSSVLTAATVSGVGIYSRASSSVAIPLLVSFNAEANASASSSVAYLSAGSAGFPAAAGTCSYTMMYQLN